MVRSSVWMTLSVAMTGNPRDAPRTKDCFQGAICLMFGGCGETDRGNGAKRGREGKRENQDVELPLIFCRESDII